VELVESRVGHACTNVLEPWNFCLSGQGSNVELSGQNKVEEISRRYPYSMLTKQDAGITSADVSRREVGCSMGDGLDVDHLRVTRETRVKRVAYCQAIVARRDVLLLGCNQVNRVEHCERDISRGACFYLPGREEEALESRLNIILSDTL
jgi:hypothetical protein